MNSLTKSILVILALASPLVEAEPDYPAADFQPKVLYKDSDYKSSDSKSKTSVSEKSSASAKDDSQYPATNFEPKVLYKDENYTPSKTAPSPSVSSSSREVQASSNNSSELSSQVTEELKTGAGSKPNLLIALAVLGIVGFVFFRKRSQVTPNKASSKGGGTSYKNATGVTGVSKYLNRVSGTGVARYIDKRVKSATAATGVSKYVAKQVLTAKTPEKVTASSTGVEKYMNKRR